MVDLIFDRRWTDNSAFGRSLSWVMGTNTVCPRLPGFSPLKGTPIPPADTQADLLSLVQRRAAEFQGKPVAVMWSGGIDSSLVCALLAGPQLHVICQPDVQQRSADFVAWLQTKGCRIHTLQRVTIEFLSQHMPILTGTHADSILLGELVDIGDFYEEVWTLSLAELIALNRESSLEQAQGHLAVIQPLLNQCPIENPTTADLAWWLDFSCLWERDLWWLSYCCGMPKGKIINFFDTDYFQAWAQRPVREKVGLNKEDHKHLYLSMIAQLCPGVALPKKGSNVAFPDMVKDFSIVAVDSNYTIYHTQEELLCALY